MKSMHLYMVSDGSPRRLVPVLPLLEGSHWRSAKLPKLGLGRETRDTTELTRVAGRTLPNVPELGH